MRLLEKLRRILATVSRTTEIVSCLILIGLAVKAIIYPVALHDIAVLVAFVGFVLVFNFTSNIHIEHKINDAIDLKKDFKLIEIQNVLLAEIKENHNQLMALFVSQSELLTRMTGAALKKTNKSEKTSNGN